MEPWFHSYTPVRAQYLSYKFNRTIAVRDRFFFLFKISIYRYWIKKTLIVINKIDKQHGQAKFAAAGDKR